MKKFTFETRRPCSRCKRDVDAVRHPEMVGLRISRHFTRADGFCTGSMLEVPTTEALR